MTSPPSVNDYYCENYGLYCSSPPPPYYSYSSPPPPSSSSSSSSLSAAAAGGIGAGVLVIIIIVIVVVVICCKKRKPVPNGYAGGQNNNYYAAAAAPAAGVAQANYAYPAAAPAAAVSTTPNGYQAAAASASPAGPTGGYYDPAKPQWQQNNNPSPPAAHYMSPQPSAPNSQGWQPPAAFHASPPSSGPYSQGTQPPAKPYMSPPSSGPYPQEQQPPAPYSSDQQTTTSVSSYGSGPPTNNSSGTVGTPKPRKQALGFSMNIFNYEELAQATDGFADSNILGQGGFGFVYKGVLPNGMEVAVKSLRADSRQGDNEFEAEIETVSRVHHRYLVSLVGYCVTDANRLLVYEYIPNGTLQYHLHAKGVPTMTWATRMKIALGSARGLAYLHEDCRPKIIHRDIKAANILLDFDFEAKVADFGLAKFTTDQSTHVSTRVMGTFGYLAPEYAASGKLTEKSDVFSFGVMLLELITGRLPHDMKAFDMDDSMVDWAKPLLQRALEDGNFDPLIDPKLENKYNREEVMRMITCAAASVRHSARRRPKMSQIVRALEGNMALADLNDGVSPGHSTVYSSQTGSEYDTAEYKQDLERFRQMVAHGIPETDVTSSEYDGSNPSGPTREGGGHISKESEMGKLKDGR